MRKGDSSFKCHAKKLVIKVIIIKNYKNEDNVIIIFQIISELLTTNVNF